MGYPMILTAEQIAIVNREINQLESTGNLLAAARKERDLVIVELTKTIAERDAARRERDLMIDELAAINRELRAQMPQPMPPLPTPPGFDDGEIRVGPGYALPMRPAEPELPAEPEPAKTWRKLPSLF